MPEFSLPCSLRHDSCFEIVETGGAIASEFVESVVKVTGVGVDVHGSASIYDYVSDHVSALVGSVGGGPLHPGATGLKIKCVWPTKWPCDDGPLEVASICSIRLTGSLYSKSKVFEATVALAVVDSSTC